MANHRSVQWFAFKFASRTYAFKCLAQGPSILVTEFGAFIRHYLDPCLAANNWTKYMDDIGSTVQNFDEFTPNLRNIIECIRRSGLKLSPVNAKLAHKKSNFLESTSHQMEYQLKIQK